jgi:hypothetical protein
MCKTVELIYYCILVTQRIWQRIRTIRPTEPSRPSGQGYARQSLTEI